MSDIPDLLQRYADYISAGDKEGILSLYAPDATCEIPVGGPVHRGKVQPAASRSSRRQGGRRLPGQRAVGMPWRDGRGRE